MSWSTPLVTQYESQYGPPLFEQAPKDSTNLGSGTCSKAASTSGASLSVTVPATTNTFIRAPESAPAKPATPVTPATPVSAPASRLSAAATSTAQQASPASQIQSAQPRPASRTTGRPAGRPARGGGRSTAATGP